MSPTVSAAQPAVMARCSVVALAMDSDLGSCGVRLDGRLSAFEARCRESGMRVSVDGVRGRVSAHARLAVNVDRFVGEVGKAFEQADRTALTLCLYALRALRSLGGGRSPQSLALWEQLKRGALAGGIGLWNGAAAVLDREADWVTELAIGDMPTGRREETNPLLVFLDILSGVNSNLGFGQLDDLLTGRMGVRVVFDLLGRVANGISGSDGHITQMRELYSSLIVERFPYWKGIDGALRRANARGFDIHMGDSPYFRDIHIGALTIVSTGLDIYRDIRERKYGEDHTKAVGVNLASTGMKLATKANPVGATVMAANAIVQLGGTATIMAEGLAINALVSDEAARTSLTAAVSASHEALKRANLDNVFDRGAETLWDYFVTDGRRSWDSAIAAGAAQIGKNQGVAGIAKAAAAFAGAYAVSEAERQVNLLTGLVDTTITAGNSLLGVGQFLVTQSVVIKGTVTYARNKLVAESGILPAEWNSALNRRADEIAIETAATARAISGFEFERLGDTQFIGQMHQGFDDVRGGISEI